MGWFAFALIAAVGFSIYSVLIRITLQDQGDAKIFALLSDLTVALFVLAVSLFDRVFIRLDVRGILLVLAASGLYAGASVLFIWGHQLEEVSRVSLARQLTTVWIFIGGVVILGEALTVPKVAGLMLIIAGGALALGMAQGMKVSKGHLLVLVGTILGGTSSIIGKTIVEDMLSPALYISSTSLLAALWLFIAFPDQNRRIMEEKRVQTWRVPAVGFSLGSTLFLLMKAYQTGDASRVGPIYASSLILTVIAGIIILKEHERIGMKLLGTAITFGGVLLLR